MLSILTIKYNVLLQQDSHSRSNRTVSDLCIGQDLSMLMIVTPIERNSFYVFDLTPLVKSNYLLLPLSQILPKKGLLPYIYGNVNLVQALRYTGI